MIVDSQFWTALLEIIWVNVLLSGDNAVVIALACRSLPKHQQKWGIILGTLPAIILRIIFAVFIIHLMTVPYLKIVGGLLLLWIAVKLLQPEEGIEEGAVTSGATMWAAVRTIVIADAVMSLDNVIAIAAAAHDDVVLLIIGLLISMPLVIFGSTLLLKVLTRFPILVKAGGALLGYIGGEVVITDPALVDWIDANAVFRHRAAPIAGAILVLIVGFALARIAGRRKPVKLVT